MIDVITEVNDFINNIVWGVTEVFFDTIIINTITGLMIIMAGVYTTGTSGTALVMESADILFGGGFGSYFILAASILFSFTCLTSSSYVCQEAAEYLFGTKSDCVIRIVWLVFIFIGSYTTLDLAWSLADTAKGLMAIPNLIGILLLSNQVVKIKKEYFKENNKEGLFSKLKKRFKKCEEN